MVLEKLGLTKLISQVKIRGRNSYSFNEAQATVDRITTLIKFLKILGYILKLDIDISNLLGMFTNFFQEVI